MGRRPLSAHLNVFMNGRVVGLYRRLASGATTFAYDRTWLDWPHAMPISLSLPLREERHTGAAVSAVFENLLPDSEPLRRRIAERIGARGVDAFSLLSAIGGDCAGALQILPEGVAPSSTEPSGEPIGTAEIASLLRALPASPLGIGTEVDLRLSIAGAQEKTALLRRGKRWLKPLGASPTTHILKPSIGRLSNGLDLTHSVENEWLCLRLLRAFGLPAAEAEMAWFEDRRALIVTRFDRRWTADGRLLRLPQEDCLQALGLPPTLKYESEGGPGAGDIFTLLKGADAPLADREFFFKALVMFWILGATDGHAKNFSLFLRPGGGFAMTPLYDVLSAEPSLAGGQLRRKEMKLAMAIGDKRRYRVDQIAPRHFLQTAKMAGMGGSQALATLEALCAHSDSALEQVFATLPPDFPAEVLEPVSAAMWRRLKLLAQFLAGRMAEQ